jgi:hypothetical protein
MSSQDLIKFQLSKWNTFYATSFVAVVTKQLKSYLFRVASGHKFTAAASSASQFLQHTYKNEEVWTARFTVLIQPRPVAVVTSSCENWRWEFVPSVLYPLFFTQIYYSLYFYVSMVTKATVFTNCA